MSPVLESSVRVGVEEVKRLRESGYRVIDVREPVEFAVGRVAGAELVPLGELEKVAGGWRRDEPLLVYCQSGGRSGQAQAVLKRLGFSSVLDLEGGFSAWSAAGLPSERSAKARWSLERQVRFTVALFVITFTALGLWVHPGFFVLIFLISAGLIFSAVTNTCGLALVLTKLPWNRV